MELWRRPESRNATNFELCWPNNDKIRAIHTEKLIAAGSEAFVRYQAAPETGAYFRNGEFFRFEGGQIREIVVYFGSVPEPETKAWALPKASLA
jgi:hypothetical protein